MLCKFVTSYTQVNLCVIPNTNGITDPLVIFVGPSSPTTVSDSSSAGLGGDVTVDGPETRAGYANECESERE